MNEFSNCDGETYIEALTRDATRPLSTIPILDMTITAREHSHTILVTVEMEDGVVSYAEIDGHKAPGGFPERCLVTTADRTVRWEYGTHDGDWRRADAKQVSISKDMQRALAQAARAGLAASGRL